jgi:hypothetical protein
MVYSDTDLTKKIDILKNSLDKAETGASVIILNQCLFKEALYPAVHLSPVFLSAYLTATPSTVYHQAVIAH